MFSLLSILFLMNPILSETEFQQQQEVLYFLKSQWTISVDEGDEEVQVIYQDKDEQEEYKRFPYRACVEISIYHNEEDSPINQKFLAALLKLHRLESISWNSNLKFEKDFQISFDCWPNLYELWIDEYLENPSALDMFCKAIGDSGNIQRVTIGVNNSKQLSDVLRAKNLEYLYLYQYGEWPQEIISEVKNLRELGLAGFPLCKTSSLSVETLKAIAKFPSLEMLWIQLENDQQLELLLPLKETLQFLVLDSSGITSKAASIICQFKKLKTLSVCFTAIGDSFIATICELPLECLGVSGTNITDDSIKYFQNWKSLKEIHVVYPRCLLTKEGIKLLRTIPGKDWY